VGNAGRRLASMTVRLRRRSESISILQLLMVGGDSENQIRLLHAVRARRQCKPVGERDLEKPSTAV
jgi:hypothetical protein